MKRKPPNNMPKKVEDVVLGWEVYFERNLHMYTHSLLLSKNGMKYSINCEWLGSGSKDGNAVGIWLYSLDVIDDIKKELINVLSLWASKFPVHIRLLISKTEFIDNK